MRASGTGEIGAREVANMVYGAARISIGELLGVLFKALATAAEHRVSKLNEQELANTAWSFATVTQSDEKLFATLVRAVEWRVREFTAQGLANAA